MENKRLRESIEIDFMAMDEIGYTFNEAREWFRSEDGKESYEIMNESENKNFQNIVDSVATELDMEQSFLHGYGYDIDN